MNCNILRIKVFALVACCPRATLVHMSARITIPVFMFLLLFATTDGIAAPRKKIEPRQPAGKIFRFRLPFEPSTLDWNKGDVPIAVIQNTMRGLFRVDEDGEIAPDLARSHSTRENGKVWTFTLREGIKWSDGVPLEARHFVDGIRRLLAPATASSYAYFLYDVEGARAFNKSGAGQPGASAPSADTLEIKLAAPVAHLPAVFTHWVTFPVRMDLIEKWKNDWREPGHMAFLGPFRIIEVRPNVRVVLEPNKFSDVKPWMNRAEGWIIPEDNTALDLYDTGHLELMTDPGQAAAKHKDMKHLPGPIAYFLGLGPGHPLTTKRAGVLALSAAIDRTLLPAALGAPHRPAAGLCPPEIWQALGKSAPAEKLAANIPLKGSPELARAFLKQAGFATPALVPPLTLKFFNRSAVRELAEWLQSEWKKNLGIVVALDAMDVKTYWAELARNPAPLFLNSKGASYPDPDAFFRMFADENAQNLGRWDDAEFDRLVAAARAASGAGDRRALYLKASARLLDENPGIIPLYFRDTQMLVKPFVKNLGINPLTSVYFSGVSY